jgi:ABC-type sugar transport system ATPase subunit
MLIAFIGAARHHGIETVYQDLALVDDLAVYQNVFLDRELTWGFGPVRFLARRAMEERTRALFVRDADSVALELIPFAADHEIIGSPHRFGDAVENGWSPSR